MEEDEEEIKYEIFPWALGKNWRKQFPRFLQQRDLLWARINFRAAVSRRCCEEVHISMIAKGRLINSLFAALGKLYCFAFPEDPSVFVFFLFLLKLYLFISWCVSPISVLQVMAIAPSHFVWKRVRSEHHSGAQRQYGDQEHTIIPRGPSASPLSCALCNQGTRSHQGPGFLSPSRGPSAQTSSPALPHPFTSILSLEITPPRASLQKTVGTKIQAQHLSSCCVGEVPSRYHLNTCTPLEYLGKISCLKIP